eukprot:8963314-Heterocapsa_arctica.AAC.1
MSKIVAGGAMSRTVRRGGSDSPTHRKTACDGVAIPRPSSTVAGSKVALAWAITPSGQYVRVSPSGGVSIAKH